jgi:hypothetical protein
MTLSIKTFSIIANMTLMSLCTTALDNVMLSVANKPVGLSVLINVNVIMLSVPDKPIMLSVVAPMTQHNNKKTCHSLLLC